jgi:hypothetical protein
MEVKAAHDALEIAIVFTVLDPHLEPLRLLLARRRKVVTSRREVKRVLPWTQCTLLGVVLGDPLARIAHVL